MRRALAQITSRLEKGSSSSSSRVLGARAQARATLLLPARQLVRVAVAMWVRPPAPALRRCGWRVRPWAGGSGREGDVAATSRWKQRVVLKHHADAPRSSAGTWMVAALTVSRSMAMLPALTRSSPATTRNRVVCRSPTGR